MMAAWLKLKKRKKVQPAEISIEPPAERRKSGLHMLFLVRNNIRDLECKLLDINISIALELK